MLAKEGREGMHRGREREWGCLGGEHRTDPESHLERGNLQHRHGRKIEKRHISARKLEQMGLGACRKGRD